MTESGVVTGLEQAWAGVRALVEGVDGEQWELPTPCAGWSVHDLVAHLGALESQFQGLPQPEVEVPPPTAGIDAWTEAGVAARREWPPERVVAEVVAASDAQLAHLRSLDTEGWNATVQGPLGETTEAGLAPIRLFDIWVHLLDLRFALGLPLDTEREPAAAEVTAARAVELAGWGATKKAGLPDGARVRLDLTGPGGVSVDVVVDGGRGRVGEPQAEAPPDAVAGGAVAFMLTASGREAMAEAVGGLAVTGDAAARFVEGYRLFS